MALDITAAADRYEKERSEAAERAGVEELLDFIDRARDAFMQKVNTGPCIHDRSDWAALKGEADRLLDEWAWPPQMAGEGEE